MCIQECWPQQWQKGCALERMRASSHDCTLLLCQLPRSRIQTGRLVALAAGSSSKLSTCASTTHHVADLLSNKQRDCSQSAIQDVHCMSPEFGVLFGETNRLLVNLRHYVQSSAASSKTVRRESMVVGLECRRLSPAHARTLVAPNAAPNGRAIRMTEMQFDRGDVDVSLGVATQRHPRRRLTSLFLCHNTCRNTLLWLCACRNSGFESAI